MKIISENITIIVNQYNNYEYNNFLHIRNIIQLAYLFLWGNPPNVYIMCDEKCRNKASRFVIKNVLYNLHNYLIYCFF